MDYRVLLFLAAHLLGSHLTHADGHSHSCFDDMVTCEDNLRKLMLDDTMFWFGQDYLKTCQAGASQFDVLCSNMDPVNMNVVSRVYNTTDNAGLQPYLPALNNLALADVNFPPKTGHYYGCGHLYYEPGTAFRLDPMKVTLVNSWILDHVPSISWPTDGGDSTLNTIVMWDVGYTYLHGLYINARGGNFETATPLDTYHGPMTARPRPNVYLFAVFKQTAFIDPGMAAGIMGALLGMNQGAFPISSFLAQMRGSISDMVAANVLTVVGDAYSMQRQKDRYIANFCPQLISQSNALKSILASNGVMASWSDEKVTLDYTQPSYMTSLTVDMMVEYSMDKDIITDACCVKSTVTQSMFRADPLGTQVVRPAVTSDTPRVHLSPVSILTDLYNSFRDKTYVLIMVDVSNPANLITHWLVANIMKGDVSRGDEILPYLGPNPFTRNKPNTYVFLLLLQKQKLDISKWADLIDDSCPDHIQNRCGLQLARMMKEWDLEEIVGVTWFQAMQDAYARKRIYTELMAKRMDEVCYGEPGYEDPCPKEQYQGGRASSGSALVSGIACTLAALSFVFVSTKSI